MRSLAGVSVSVTTNGMGVVGTFSRVTWPKISTIPGQVTRENVPTTPIPFVVTDTETPANDLILFGNSSNTNLVPDENFIFGGTATNRSLILVPAPNHV